MYNSDSDSGSDDEDEQGGNGAQKRGGKSQQAQQAQGKNGANKRDKRAGQQQFIRNEGDEPMDLLSRSIAGGVTSAFLAHFLYCATADMRDMRYTVPIPMMNGKLTKRHQPRDRLAQA